MEDSPAKSGGKRIVAHACNAFQLGSQKPRTIQEPLALELALFNLFDAIPANVPLDKFEETSLVA